SCVLAVWFQLALALPVVAPDSSSEAGSPGPRKLSGSSAPPTPTAPGIRSASAGIVFGEGCGGSDAIGDDSPKSSGSMSAPIAAEVGGASRSGGGIVAPASP